MKKTSLALALSGLLAGCATAPDHLQTMYVSPMQYKDYDCSQVGSELARVARRAQELQVSLQRTADNDAAQMAVGMILFWPALFFLEGGDGPEAAEYSRLKGERDALEQVAVAKHCDEAIIPPHMPVAKPVNAAPEN